MKNNHYMIDIECLSASPNGIITNIAVVHFNIETFEIYREFEYKVDINSSVGKGFEVESSTLQWLIAQNERVQANMLTGVSDIKTSLKRLYGFINHYGDEMMIWGNPAHFDVGRLEAAYHKLNIIVPWKYNQVADVMTLKRMIPIDEPTTKNDHLPINDCKSAIEELKLMRDAISPKLKLVI